MSLEISLRHLAKEQGLTLKEVADRAGISRATVYRVFRQTQNPRVETLKKIAVALGADWTFTVDGRPTFRKGNARLHMQVLMDICENLSDDGLLRVLWYARYERDHN